MRNNHLSNAEKERLIILIEECSEVIHISSKIIRHGYEAYNPMIFNSISLSNKENLEMELGHLKNSIFLLINSKDVSLTKIRNHQVNKSSSIKQYLRHQREINATNNSK